METNKVELTGKVKNNWSVKTNTGVMSKTLLTVDKHTFWILGFGNVGRAILKLNEGDELGVRGTGQIKSWQTDDKVWRNDFQCVAWSVEIGGEEIKFQKQGDRQQNAVKMQNAGQPIPKHANGGFDDPAPSGEDVIF